MSRWRLLYRMQTEPRIVCVTMFHAPEYFQPYLSSPSQLARWVPEQSAITAKANQWNLRPTIKQAVWGACVPNVGGALGSQSMPVLEHVVTNVCDTHV
jgi:hypothetical protein